MNEWIVKIWLTDLRQGPAERELCFKVAARHSNRAWG